MGRLGFLIGRIVISVILVPMIMTFIVLYSVNQNINKENIKEILQDVALEVISEQISSQVEQRIDGGSEQAESFINETAGVDFNTIYEQTVIECLTRENIIIEEIQFNMDCNELANINPEELETILKDKINEKLEEEIGKELQQQGGLDSVAELFGYVNIALFVIGGLSIVLILAIILLCVPKYKFGINLGIVGMLSGLPFLFVNSLKISEKYSNIGTIQSIVDSLIGSLFINFLIVFILGAALLFFGIFVSIGLGKKWEKMARRKK